MPLRVLFPLLIFFALVFITLSLRSGLRSGTLPAPLAVGLGAACAVAQEDMAFDSEHINRLSKRLKHGIMDKVGRCAQWERNGKKEKTGHWSEMGINGNKWKTDQYNKWKQETRVSNSKTTT